MPHQGEGGRGWSGRSVRRNKGDSAQKWHLSKAEAVTARACTGSIRNSLDLCLWVDCFSPCLVKSWEPTGSLLLSTAPPWGRHAMLRSGEHTHSRETEQLRPCTQAFCSSSVESAPLSVGWWQSLCRGEALAHTWLQPQPRHLQSRLLPRR